MSFPFDRPFVLFAECSKHRVVCVCEYVCDYQAYLLRVLSLIHLAGQCEPPLPGPGVRLQQQYCSL